MSNIAIAQICIMEKRDGRERTVGEVKEEEYRFTMWQRSRRHEAYEVTPMQSYLTYTDKSIEEIIDGIKFNYRQHSMPAKPSVERDGDDLGVLVKAQIDALGEFRVIRLGEFQGTECYLILKANADDKDGWFHIKSMPDHWLPNVVYRPETVRETFGRVNVTMVTHAGGTSARDLFEYIDSKARFYLPTNVL